MPEATLPHPQGAPCWIDIALDSQSAALDFYRPLFGWSGEPGPAEFGGYAVMEVGGKPVAGIMQTMPDQPASAPVWTVYFAVEDVAASAARVRELGGTVFMGPQEVPTTGVMALALDPEGAVFGLWQPQPFTGIGVVGEPGAPCWFELESTRGEEAGAFYAGVFGTASVAAEAMPGEYWLLQVGDRQVAGIWKASGDRAATAPRWQTYLQVADADKTIERASAAGAKVLRAATDTPFGRFAILADPFGAQFAIMAVPAAS
jgi:predicted enzyme related to lactoylglutathione lyase